MPELTAVREVSHNQASDNGGRNLTINDIDNFAALLKGASDRNGNSSANSILPSMEIIDDAPVSRCGKPKDDQVAKCFTYEGQPERKDSKVKHNASDDDEIKIHRPMLKEDEPKIHRPMLEEEPKIHRPMLEEQPKIHRPMLEDEIKIHRPMLGDVKAVHNINDPKEIGGMVDQALNSHSRDGMKQAVENLAELAQKALEKSGGSNTDLRKFEESINDNIKANGKGVILEAVNGKVHAHIVESVSKREMAELRATGKDGDVYDTKNYGYLRDLVAPVEQPARTRTGF